MKKWKSGNAGALRSCLIPLGLSSYIVFVLFYISHVQFLALSCPVGIDLPNPAVLFHPSNPYPPIRPVSIPCRQSLLILSFHSSVLRPNWTVIPLSLPPCRVLARSLPAHLVHITFPHCE